MPNVTTDAFVLRVAPSGASDKLLTLISPNGGRFYAILKGGNSIKNRQVAATEPYTWSNFEFYERGGFKWVKSATAIETFGGLRYDSEKLFVAGDLKEAISIMNNLAKAGSTVLFENDLPDLYNEKLI